MVLTATPPMARERPPGPGAHAAGPPARAVDAAAGAATKQRAGEGGRADGAASGAGTRVQRHVVHGRYGSCVVEVDGDRVYVDGVWVEPAQPAGPAAASGGAARA